MGAQDFDWSDQPSTIECQPEIMVYPGANSHVVIRARSMTGDDDAVVLVLPNNVPKLVRELREAAKLV